MKRSAGLVLARGGAIAAYLAAVIAPLVVSYALDPYAAERTPVVHLGLASSLAGFAVLALQPLLSARPKWLDRLFGLDGIYRFHKAMAVAAGVLIVVHPLLLVLDFRDPLLLTGFDWPWPVLLGRLGILAIVVIVLSSLLYGVIRVSYERWRGLHAIAAVVLLAAGFVHAWFTGRDLGSAPMRAIFAFLLAVAACSYAVHRLAGPALRRRRTWTVTEVRQEADTVWTLAFAPGPETPPLRHHPGQFQFIALERTRRRNRPSEEHPFTISSGGEAGGAHQSTIKESGDFTSRIRDVLPGDRVRVHGPFGRFSYSLHPDESDFVFIAGGIGITPFMSMIRRMRAERSPARVLLVHATRSSADVVFDAELAAVARGGSPRLDVVRVLQNPPAGWQGERGRIDAALLDRLLGGAFAGRAFYVCGPGPMMNAVLRLLRRRGVPRRRLHAERFAL